MDACSFGVAQVYNRGATRRSLAPRCEQIIQIGPSEEGIGGSPGAHGYITALTHSSRRHLNSSLQQSPLSVRQRACSWLAHTHTRSHAQARTQAHTCASPWQESATRTRGSLRFPNSHRRGRSCLGKPSKNWEETSGCSGLSKWKDTNTRTGAPTMESLR